MENGRDFNVRICGWCCPCLPTSFFIAVFSRSMRSISRQYISKSNSTSKGPVTTRVIGSSQQCLSTDFSLSEPQLEQGNSIQRLFGVQTFLGLLLYHHDLVPILILTNITRKNCKLRGIQSYRRRQGDSDPVRPGVRTKCQL